MTEQTAGNEIVRHYEKADEDNRLRKGPERLELLRMQDILRRVLPPAPARILDVGGATGVHAEWLAADGYHVHVLDPVARHVEKAALIPGVSASVGDARKLDAQDGAYDAVLLFGPLYHLVDAADRLTVLREAARVTVPGGVVACAAIARCSSFFDGVRRGFLARPGASSIVERTLDDGVHDPGDLELFTTAFLHEPDELVDEIRTAGLDAGGAYAVEGPAWLIGGLEPWLDDDEKRELLLRGLRRLEREPSILGASRHLLAVATNPARDS